MTSFFRLTLFLMVLGGVCGCSKEEIEAPKVNVQANIQKLRSSDPNDRMEGAINLGMAGSGAEPAVPELIQLLQDADPAVRRVAAYALGEIGPPASDAIPQLRKMMENDPDRDVRFQVVNTLRSIDPRSLSEGP